MPTPSQFAAVNPALGYLYQVRAALLWSLQRLQHDESFQVSVEVLDDVAFESNTGDPSTFLQTKHHASRMAALTDSCPDLWKTLRVWIEGGAVSQILSTASLQLVTTGVAPIRSAASKLKIEDRDAVAARDILDVVARTSTNAANAAAYRAYELLSAQQRLAMLERVFVIDAAPTISDLDQELRTVIFWAVDRANQTPFLDRLEGWWLRKVIGQLTSSPGARIASVEIESEMSDLRDQFRQDSLPIDDDLLDFVLDDTTAVAHRHYRFVKQLEIIDAGRRRVSSAIRDFYRAYEQRSRWVREDLVVTLDISRFEKRLTEEWENVFDAVCDEVGEAATDAERKAAARSVLQWAERTSIPIRPGVTEPFLCRGSLHMIADEGNIGWHPDFKTLLDTVLNGTEGVT
ncbi:ABC-three component system protein [Pseudomonas sp. Tri1]|uniref:ABC-three component system protein n=1 Tax=Pseudomonas sp. Tri1 TaxID=2823875 RepID=UPI001B319468|nr:ABC-three component system protein [Pseudomonas sp. Tri1]